MSSQQSCALGRRLTHGLSVDSSSCPIISTSSALLSGPSSVLNAGSNTGKPVHRSSGPARINIRCGRTSSGTLSFVKRRATLPNGSTRAPIPFGITSWRVLKTGPGPAKCIPFFGTTRRFTNGRFYRGATPAAPRRPKTLGGRRFVVAPSTAPRRPPFKVKTSKLDPISSAREARRRPKRIESKYYFNFATLSTTRALCATGGEAP